MLEESLGLGERRATTIVTVLLFAEAIWVFLFKYLPLDAGLWTLQAELVARHLTGHATPNSWSLIHFPASNILAPLISGILSLMMSSELAVRLLLTFVAILLRGLGIVVIFRTLRVRDLGVYLIVPVLTLSGIWYTGALPYLMGETLAIWLVAFFLAQHYPRSIAYWTLSIGLGFVSMFSALAFLFAGFVIVTVMLEQRRSVHLSQGWLNEPRAVLSLLVPGALMWLLGLIAHEPIFRLSTSNLIPDPGFSRLLFLVTPAPDVLEATFRYGDLVHAVEMVLSAIVIFGCFARAYFLAIEEVTWQSRALRTAGYFLLVLALLGPLIARIGVETSSGCTFAIVLILAGSYSRGPAVRRTHFDQLLSTLTVLMLIGALGMNGYSIAAGSEAASSVMKSARSLMQEDPDVPHVKSDVHFVIDSSLLQHYAVVGTLSYSVTAPLYLFISTPDKFQPRGGLVKTSDLKPGLAISPARPLLLGSPERYTDTTVRVLAALPKAGSASANFGPYPFFLEEEGGLNIDKDEAHYRLAIGRLRVGRPVGLALSEP